MPHMDGIEVLQELIKRQFKGRFMLISGHDMQTLPLARELAEASLVNFAGAFVKPISKETLAHALKLA
jgi:YesN/AraC family two-component response regulator